MTVREMAAIRLAATHYAHPGAKTADAMWLLGMNEVRFAQVVGALIERGDVEAAYPAQVRRLRRLRDGRRALRRRRQYVATV